MIDEQAPYLVPVVTPTLAELEQVIEQGKDAFIRVGVALLDIRDRRLYREAGYSRFEDYCRERWGFGRTQAYELIDAAEVTRAITDYNEYVAAGRDLDAVLPVSGIPDTGAVPISLPINAAQAVELAPLLRQTGAFEMLQTWSDLKAQYGERVTAKLTRDAVATRIERSDKRAFIPVLEFDAPDSADDVDDGTASRTNFATDSKNASKAGMIVLWAVDAAELLLTLAATVPDVGMQRRIKETLDRWPRRPTLYDPQAQALVSPDYQRHTSLTAAEAVVIERFMQVPGWMVNLGQIMDALNWERGWGTDDSVRKMIVDLRRKLEALGWSENIFENERDLGWKINRAEVKAAWDAYLQSLTTR